MGYCRKQHPRYDTYLSEPRWHSVRSVLTFSSVFFVKDAMKFMDLNRSEKKDPRTNLPSAVSYWDFFSHMPETMHQVSTTPRKLILRPKLQLFHKPAFRPNRFFQRVKVHRVCSAPDMVLRAHLCANAKKKNINGWCGSTYFQIR